jgi:hypothetical protein
MKRVCLMLTDPQVRLLDAEAEMRGIGRSELVRHFVDLFQASLVRSRNAGKRKPRRKR